MHKPDSSWLDNGPLHYLKIFIRIRGRVGIQQPDDRTNSLRQEFREKKNLLLATGLEPMGF